MSRGARLELLARLRAEGHLTDDEYRILTGTGLGWAGALYYVGGGLLLIGAAALAAEFWVGGSIVGHLALSVALDGLLFAGAMLLRRRGHESPAMLLLLGSLLASRLVAVSALQVVGPPMTSAAGLSGAGALAASAVMLVAAIACAMVWSAPVVSAAAIATSAIFVQSAAALACGSDAGCPAVRLSLLALGAVLFFLGIRWDRAASAEQTAVGPDHAFWYSMLGLIAMDVALVQIFSWDTLGGVLFLALQGVSLALSVQAGRSVLGVLSAVGAVVYIEAQLIRAFSGSPLAGPLAAVLLGAAALYAGILVRRRGGRVRARMRGSIWL